jgi:hypothetical protein
METDMTALARPLFLVLASAACTSAVADPQRMSCENWHATMGRAADVVIAVDTSKKLCNGSECSISDTELRWSEGGGRHQYIVNRALAQGQILATDAAGVPQKFADLKNCRAI